MAIFVMGNIMISQISALFFRVCPQYMSLVTPTNMPLPLQLLRVTVPVGQQRGNMEYYFPVLKYLVYCFISCVAKLCVQTSSVSEMQISRITFSHDRVWLLMGFGLQTGFIDHWQHSYNTHSSNYWCSRDHFEEK